MASAVERDSGSRTTEQSVFGSHEIAFECLADVDRTRRFAEAIQDCVGLSSQVLELGTGTGILAMMAARAGASRIDAYEINPATAALARDNIAANGLQSAITVHEEDATLATFAGSQYGVLVAEMIAVGLIEEHLVPAFNNVINRDVMSRSAHAIPRRQLTHCQMVEADFDFFGFKVASVQIEQTWQESRVLAMRSEPVLVSSVDFEEAIAAAKPINPMIEGSFRIPVTNGGTVNAVRLTSESELRPGLTSGWTQCMNSPAIIPIPTMEVALGQEIQLELQYEMGGQFQSLELQASRVTKR